MRLNSEEGENRTITIPELTGKVVDGGTLNKVGRIQIEPFVELEKLSVRDLVIDVGVNYIVRNETADLISIQTYEQDPPHSEALIIPPFGSRWLNSEYLKDYDFLNSTICSAGSRLKNCAKAFSVK